MLLYNTPATPQYFLALAVPIDPFPFFVGFASAEADGLKVVFKHFIVCFKLLSIVCILLLDIRAYS
jgi:hypothetical protein